MSLHGREKPARRGEKRGRSTAPLITAVAAAVLAALLLFAPGALAAWPTPQKVSNGTIAGNDAPQIELDSAGNPNVVWFGNDGSTWQIYYAENTGSGWTPQKVSTGTMTNNFNPQIALDSAGNPNVVWYGYDGSAWQVYYAENTGSGWTPQKVSTGTSTDNSVPQIALDSGGNPNVVWFGNDGSTYQVYYAENTGSGWTAQKVSTGTTTNNDAPQIALDSAGNPNVVWFGNDGTTNQVYYAENTGGGWTPQKVSTGTLTDNAHPQIALDSAGNPNVVWYGNDGTTNQVYYAKNTGSGWTPQKVSTSTTTSSFYPQIALDSGGNPNVVWYGNDGTAYQVYYAENTGSGWTPQKVSTGITSSSSFPHIALDSGGNPNVVWEGDDGTTSQVYYAENTGSGWTPRKVSTGTTTNNLAPQIALDSGGNPNVVWHGYDASAYQVYYSAPIAPTVTTTAPSNITSTTADSGGNVTSDGGDPVTARGVCWSTSANPTTSDDHTSDGTGTGTYTSSITGLDPGTTYHVRAYATNGVGTSYGADLEFTTPNPVTPTTWYLAEGTNAWGFSTYITIENPQNEQLTARITYMNPNPASGAGVVGTRTVVLPPLSQTTVSSASDIGLVDFSTEVQCLQGKTIAVDRTMFWTGPGAPSQEGHSSIGTTSPAKTWYLPEGSSAWGFETWTLIENPGATVAHVKFTYMTESGTPQVLDKTVGAHCRATYNMASDIGNKDASIKVTSDIPVVAERSMYRNNRREGSCSIGATAPATDYYLAEGATGYDVGFTTYVLVQNPNNSDVQVTLTYMTPAGPKPQAPFTMAANSRKTVKVNDALPANTSVSTQVHGSKPIIAERAMYWGAGTPLGEAMHASVGLDSAHMSFYLPDGQTSNGHETWTLVQNPNPGAVTVRVTYLPQGGRKSVTFTDEIAPNSRKTYSMADKIASGRASIMVQSLDGARPIMVERSMYWNNRGAGTDTVGGYSDPTD